MSAQKNAQGRSLEVSLYCQKADSAIRCQKKRRLHAVIYLQSEGNTYFCLEVRSSVKSVFFNRNMNLSGESVCVSEEFRQSSDERCNIQLTHNHFFEYFRSVNSIPLMLLFVLLVVALNLYLITVV